MRKKIDRYKLLRELGADALTMAYEASAEGAAAPVRLLVGKVPVQLSPEERALAERARVATLELPAEHAGHVLELGFEYGMPFAAEPLVPASSLSERLTGPLAPELVALLARDLATPLSEAHRGRPALVHGAISPDVVLVDASGRARLTGFVTYATCLRGVASMPMLKSLMEGYQPPEQLAGEAVGPAGDLFSLGAVLLHAVLGAPPAGRAAAAGPEALGGALEGVGPPELAALIPRLLSSDPAARGTAAGLLDELAIAVADLPAARRALAEALSIPWEAPAEASRDEGGPPEVAVAQEAREPVAASPPPVGMAVAGFAPAAPDPAPLPPVAADPSPRAPAPSPFRSEPPPRVDPEELRPTVKDIPDEIREMAQRAFGDLTLEQPSPVAVPTLERTEELLLPEHRVPPAARGAAPGSDLAAIRERLSEFTVFGVKLSWIVGIGAASVAVLLLTMLLTIAFAS